MKHHTAHASNQELDCAGTVTSKCTDTAASLKPRATFAAGRIQVLAPSNSQRATSTAKESFVAKTRRRAQEAEYYKQLRLAQLEAECELEENIRIRTAREVRARLEEERRRSAQRDRDTQAAAVAQRAQDDEAAALVQERLAAAQRVLALDDDSHSETREAMLPPIAESHSDDNVEAVDGPGESKPETRATATEVADQGALSAGTSAASTENSEQINAVTLSEPLEQESRASHEQVAVAHETQALDDDTQQAARDPNPLPPVESYSDDDVDDDDVPWKLEAATDVTTVHTEHAIDAPLSESLVHEYEREDGVIDAADSVASISASNNSDVATVDELRDAHNESLEHEHSIPAQGFLIDPIDPHTRWDVSESAGATDAADTEHDYEADDGDDELEENSPAVIASATHSGEHEELAPVQGFLVDPIDPHTRWDVSSISGSLGATLATDPRIDGSSASAEQEPTRDVLTEHHDRQTPPHGFLVDPHSKIDIGLSSERNNAVDLSIAHGADSPDALHQDHEQPNQQRVGERAPLPGFPLDPVDPRTLVDVSKTSESMNTTNPLRIANDRGADDDDPSSQAIEPERDADAQHPTSSDSTVLNNDDAHNELPSIESGAESERASLASEASEAADTPSEAPVQTRSPPAESYSDDDDQNIEMPSESTSEEAEVPTTEVAEQDVVTEVTTHSGLSDKHEHLAPVQGFLVDPVDPHTRYRDDDDQTVEKPSKSESEEAEVTTTEVAEQDAPSEDATSELRE